MNEYENSRYIHSKFSYFVEWGKLILVIVPIAFVRPSLNIILEPMRRNTGCFINEKRTIALSPVLICCTDILIILAVCLILPQ
jgi:hypothetical protein